LPYSLNLGTIAIKLGFYVFKTTGKAALT